MARKLIQRGNFTSKADPGAKINAFIGVFNKTMAKPFKWTYARRKTFDHLIGVKTSAYVI